MLRANAGIQGWQGKPGRLPAEETLQFEKKNSSHPPFRSVASFPLLQQRKRKRLPRRGGGGGGVLAAAPGHVRFFAGAF